MIPCTACVAVTFGSQNFEMLDQTSMVLNENNSVFLKVSECDVFAFQNLAIPNSRWKVNTPGIINTFDMKAGKNFGWFAAIGYKPDTKYNAMLSYGLYIHPNFNFKVEKIEAKYKAKDFKGGLVVIGTLFGSHKTAMVSVFLTYDPAEGGYESESNREIMNEILEYVKQNNVKYVLMMGDFCTKFSTFKKWMADWRIFIPHMYLRSDVDGYDKSIVTCFNSDGFANPDHIITNFDVCSFNTQWRIPKTTHCYIGGNLSVMVPEDKKRLKEVHQTTLSIENQ